MHLFFRTFNNNNNNNNNNNGYVCSPLCRSKNKVMKSTDSVSCIRKVTGSNFLPGYGLS
jgi:hypothetical protein